MQTLQATPYKRPADTVPFTPKQLAMARLYDKGVDLPVLNAIRSVPREFYCKDISSDPKEIWGRQAIRVDDNSTVSHIDIVAQMYQKAGIKPHQTVVIIGAGIGYSDAVAKELVGDGQVFSIENSAKLAAKARQNHQEAGYDITVIHADGFEGLPSLGSVDCVLVFAAADKILWNWGEQLPSGGHMIQPLDADGGKAQFLVEVKNENGRLAIHSLLDNSNFIPLTPNVY